MALSPRSRPVWPLTLSLAVSLGAAHGGAIDEAREALAGGRVEAAVRVLEEARRARPQDPELAKELGRALARAGRYLESWRATRAGLGLRPSDPPLIADLRRIRKPLIGELRRRLKARPGDPEARHGLAFLLALQDRRAAAIEQLRGLTQSHPGYAPAWQDLGWLEVVAGRPAEGTQSLNKAFELDPGSAAVRRHLRFARAAREDPPAPGPDPFYGLFSLGAAASPPAATPARPAAAPDPGGSPATARTPPARIDFGRVDLDDDSLVASLLKRIEADAPPAAPAPAPTDPAPTEPEDPAPDPGELAPTPLEILKRIQDSYDRGLRFLDSRRYAEAEKAFEFVLNLRPDYRDAADRLRGARRALESLRRYQQLELMLQVGDGGQAGAHLARLDQDVVKAAHPEVDFDALKGRVAYLQGDLQTAADRLAKAVVRAPKAAELRHTLYLALTRQGRAKEALHQLRVLDTIAPGYAGRQEGHSKRLARLYVVRYFPFLVLLAVGWVAAGIGYLVYFGRRKQNVDAWGDGSEAVQEALRTESFGAALEALGSLEGLRLDPDQEARVRAWRVRALVGTRDLEAAYHELEALERLTGETPASRVLRGRVFFAEGRTAREDRVYLRDLLDAEPSNQKLLEHLHGAAWADHSRDPADREVLSKLLELDPDHPEWLPRQVEWYLEDGVYDERAAAVYARLYRLDAAHPGAAAGLARTMLVAGKPLEALGLAKEALRKHPSQPSLLETASLAYHQLALFEEGVQFFERLADRGAPGVEAALAKLKAAAAAADAARRTSQEEEKAIGGAYDRGVELFSAGRYAEALPHLDAAAEVATYRLHAGALRVKAHLALGDVEAALGRFRDLDVPDTEPGEFMIGLCYDMGRALQARGELPAARDLFRKVCKADVGYRDAFDRFEALEEQLQLTA